LLKHISEILTAATLNRHRPAGDTSMTRIWDIWDEVLGDMGKDTAMNAKPGAFKDGVLIVNVSSSVWIHKLRFSESEIIRNINKKLNSIPVKKIRFQIGKILG
jgi:predicted nucleic acid-binding Zn ribbon protein